MQKLLTLRQSLAIDADIVSEVGRQKTLEVFGEPLSPRQVVEHICKEVKARGINAVLEFSLKLDGAELNQESLRVPTEELETAHANADESFLAMISRIRENILRFQTAILHSDVKIDLPKSGGWLRQRYRPLRRIGCCVPGGAAAYPSTVLMTVIPAQAAGVKEIVVVAPPTPFGSYNQQLLATCHALGVTEVYRVGGAQAVAAMAYGVSGLPEVDKIVGPGNLFVALAKKHVFGTVDIDSIAGPSEVVVIADESVSPDWVAADLIAQAEHSPGSSILISWSKVFMNEVQLSLEKQLTETPRGDLAKVALETFGAFVLVANRAEAIEITNMLAPEHLHMECEGAEAMSDSIVNAGATFVGAFTPVALGDYVAGPSHVLPTSGNRKVCLGPFFQRLFTCR